MYTGKPASAAVLAGTGFSLVNWLWVAYGLFVLAGLLFTVAHMMTHRYAIEPVQIDGIYKWKFTKDGK